MSTSSNTTQQAENGPAIRVRQLQKHTEDVSRMMAFMIDLLSRDPREIPPAVVELLDDDDETRRLQLRHFISLVGPSQTRFLVKNFSVWGAFTADDEVLGSVAFIPPNKTFHGGRVAFNQIVKVAFRSNRAVLTAKPAHGVTRKLACKCAARWMSFKRASLKAVMALGAELSEELCGNNKSYYVLIEACADADCAARYGVAPLDVLRLALRPVLNYIDVAGAPVVSFVATDAMFEDLTAFGFEHAGDVDGAPGVRLMQRRPRDPSAAGDAVAPSLVSFGDSTSVSDGTGRKEEEGEDDDDDDDEDEAAADEEPAYTSVAQAFSERSARSLSAAGDEAGAAAEAATQTAAATTTTTTAATTDAPLLAPDELLELHRSKRYDDVKRELARLPRDKRRRFKELLRAYKDRKGSRVASRAAVSGASSQESVYDEPVKPAPTTQPSQITMDYDTIATEMIEARRDSESSGSLLASSRSRRHAFSVGELKDDSRVVYVRELGRGAYGVVWLATIGAKQVAVKRIVTEQTADADAELRKELKVLLRVPAHPNVLGLLGVILRPVSLVLEYCADGDLASYLRARAQSIVKGQHVFSLPQRLWLLYDVCCGVDHLHAHHIVHRDLACRNLLLSRSGVRIADFGYSRELDAGQDKGETASEIGPIRHFAPECLLRRHYSPKSDVWAFGVTMYEIESNGGQPYGERTNAQVAIAVGRCVDGAPGGPPPLLLPPSSPSCLVDMQVRAMRADADARPSFDELAEVLQALMSDIGADLYYGGDADDEEADEN